MPPDFDLRIEAPQRLHGAPGDLERVEASVILKSVKAPEAAEIGAQGWALSIRTSEPGVAVEVTTDGTAADAPPVGYFRDGFQITELTTGPGNEGVISVVALAFRQPSRLPASGEATLLRITLEARVPGTDEGPLRLGLEFIDGLTGSGQPIINALTFVGQRRKDDGGENDNDRDVEQPAKIVFCSEAPFVRGNCALDARLDITDAIVSLGYLFLGADEPPCLDACDIDDDENINITDPINLLNFLFLGGPPPRPPTGACGLDPTPGKVDCCQERC